MIKSGETCVKYSQSFSGPNNLIIVNGKVIPPGLYSYTNCKDNSTFWSIISLVVLLSIIILIIGCCFYCRFRRINRKKLIVCNQQQIQEKAVDYVYIV